MEYRPYVPSVPLTRANIPRTYGVPREGGPLTCRACAHHGPLNGRDHRERHVDWLEITGRLASVPGLEARVRAATAKLIEAVPQEAAA